MAYIVFRLDGADVSIAVSEVGVSAIGVAKVGVSTIGVAKVGVSTAGVAKSDELGTFS